MEGRFRPQFGLVGGVDFDDGEGDAVMAGLVTNIVCRVAAQMLTAKATGRRRVRSILRSTNNKRDVSRVCEGNTASTVEKNAAGFANRACSSV
jgi:hypothetical protein